MSRISLLLVAGASVLVVVLLFVVGRGDREGLRAGPQMNGVPVAPKPPEDLPPPPLLEEGNRAAAEARRHSSMVSVSERAKPDTRPLVGLDMIKAQLARKQWHEALNELDRRLAADPGEVGSLSLRGKIFLDLGWNRRAEKDLAKADRKGREDPARKMEYAEALLRLHLDSRAEDVLRQALSLNPKSARGHALFAVLLLRDGKQTAAKKEIREAVRIDPSDPLTKRLSGKLKPR